MRIHVLILSIFILSDTVKGQPLHVSEARASQRAGTKLVDISYDVSGGEPPYTISLQGSLNGGQAWTIPVTTIAGHIGSGISPGTNRLVTWNAGADWTGQVSSNIRFRLIVQDSAAPDGFAAIPGGWFLMGDVTDGDPWGDSSPVRVHVSGFYMAKHEVGKELWDEVMTWARGNGYNDLQEGAGKTSDHPIVGVSWWDSVKWCNALSEMQGLTPVYTVNGQVMRTGATAPVVAWSANGFRLPTEAEWEKAARGGVVGKRFPWGTDTISHINANFFAWDSEYGNQDVEVGLHPLYHDESAPFTAPIGSFAPNPYGLHNVAGNAWEWCWDHFAVYVDGANNPTGPESGSWRILRGGGWYGGAISCRASDRYFAMPEHIDVGVGFRLARSIIP